VMTRVRLAIELGAFFLIRGLIIRAANAFVY